MAEAPKVGQVGAVVNGRMETLIRTAKFGVLRGFAVAAMALALAPQAHGTYVVSLQNYYNIGVVGLVSATVDNTGSTETTSEGIAASGTLDGTGAITGNVYESVVNQTTTCGAGCVVDSSDLGSGGTLVSHASTDASVAASLGVTDNVGAISATRTVNAGSLNENVLTITNINLSNGNNLTLHGTASDYFIVLISGTATLNGNASIDLSGGLLAENVLYVFTGTGTDSFGTGTVNGTLLSESANYTINLTGTVVNGTILNGGHTNLDGGTINGSFAYAGAPEPGTWILLGAGLAGLGLFQLYRRKRNPAPAAA
jgi:hypothetical protein